MNVFSDVQDLKAFGVNTLVRVCAATYDKSPVEQEGIRVLVSHIRPLNTNFYVIQAGLIWKRHSNIPPL